MKLAAVGTNRPCHRRLIDAGHEVVLIIEPDKVVDSDREHYSAVVPLADDGVEDPLIAPLIGIDRVVFYHDAYASRAVRIAQRLGVPHSADLDVAARFADKVVTRQRTAGVAAGSVRWALLDAGTPEGTFVRAADDLGYPLVVKPVASEASMGVSVVETPSELMDAVRVASALSTTGVLLEERLIGPEFSVETLSVDGVHHVLGVTEKFTFDASPVECGHVLPARIADEDQMALASAAVQVLDAIGLQQGAGHTEFILTDEGPRLVESHDRMGGDRIALLVELATGVDYTALAASIGAGLPVSPPSLLPRRSDAAAVWFVPPIDGPDAVLVGVEGEDEARAVARVHSVELLKKPGSLVGPLRGSFDRVALVVTTAPDAQTALDAAREAAGHLRVRVTPP
ncbi:ATP-grasp domain-containing protein [Clavibacter sp. VKM Ac-2872]|uniref:ATP-grasp domain-containing protein n=1 Tax=Clavibacter sp. VKM Ac-2872 TaxID=2783812 RepID=UPI00188CAC5C|nr:ATP-grasp domain-containing protein [Clavibacter sp. VKM Ac-2872]MBF4622772.1 ATP-grasp domain-containing protein [Clavibacter sp. VKM Ac-2872]